MAVGETEVARLLVRLMGDGSEFKKMMGDAVKTAEGVSKQVSKKLGSIGKSATKKVTLPIVGAAGVAIKFSQDLNRSMANVQSLGLDTVRTEELKKDVQAIAVEVGKGTGDIAAGLYQVVSAFGDSAESADVLRINAKAAKAGLATTEQAIALTSAVTKGYGDTTKEAVQHTSDLAFQAVKLGQTTFPELAGAMGKVVPMASTLGATQEELFAQFATLTGVTGNAAEVATQLKATYQAILKPTEEMGKAIREVAFDLKDQGELIENKFTKAWIEAEAAVHKGREKLTELQKDSKKNKTAIADQAKVMKELDKAAVAAAKGLGTSIVESKGFTESLNLLSAEANGNTSELGKMYGSSEALNAVLALSGSQADTFKEKFAAMQGPLTSVNDAFAAQTEGLAAAAFGADQLKIKMQVLAEAVGDKLTPIFSKLLDKVISAVDWFSDLSEKTQEWILIAAAGAATLGPFALLLSGIAGSVPLVLKAVKGTILISKLLASSSLGLAAGGVGLLGVALFQVIPALTGFNDQLAKAKELQDILSGKSKTQADKIAAKAASLEGPEKIAFLEKELERSKAENQGAAAMQRMEQDKFDAQQERDGRLAGFRRYSTHRPEFLAAEQSRIEAGTRVQETGDVRMSIEKQLREAKKEAADPAARANANNLAEQTKLMKELVDKSSDTVLQGAVQ